MNILRFTNSATFAVQYFIFSAYFNSLLANSVIEKLNIPCFWLALVWLKAEIVIFIKEIHKIILTELSMWINLVFCEQVCSV